MAFGDDTTGGICSSDPSTIPDNDDDDDDGNDGTSIAFGDNTNDDHNDTFITSP